jgi:hypothetical protein
LTYDGTDYFNTLMFFNRYHADMNGVLFTTTFRLDHYEQGNSPTGYDDFRIWVFSGDSTFVNEGDGGYANWAFTGNDSDVSASVDGGCLPIPCTVIDRTIHFPARNPPTTAVGAGTGANGSGSAGATGPGISTGNGGGGGAGSGSGGSGVPSAGSGTPVGGTPLTPQGPVVSPGIPSAGGGTPIGNTPSTPQGSLAPGSGGPGLPLYPAVKTGSGPIATGAASGPSIVAGASGAEASGWLLTPLGSGRYEITSAVNGRALTENTKSYFAEADPWTGSDQQKWQLVNEGDGLYQIRITDQDCLTYDEDAKALGVWTCDNAWNQQWKLQ